MPQLPTQAKGTHEQDLLVVNNILKEDFTVHWGGQPFPIKEGERKIFPRFIAEHMAKHMADRYLLLEEKRRETKSGKKLDYSILNNKTMRTNAVNAILPEVYQYYLQQPVQTDQAKAASQVEQVNETAEFDRKATDLGEVPDKALGVLSDVPVPPEQPKTPPAQASEYSMTDPNKPKPSIEQLRTDAKKLGIEYSETDTLEQLWEKISAF